MLCLVCSDNDVPALRFKLGYKTCLVCGEKRAREVKHTIVPVPKSNYVYVSPGDTESLKSPYSHKGNR